MSVQGRISRKVSAGILVNHIYAAAINRDGDLLPNFTLPDYENTMNTLGGISGLRYLAFSPLVTNKTRNEWEEYAASHVNLLHGPSSLNTSTGGSWTVADGISNSSSTNIRVREPTSDLMFPVWQVAPMKLNSALVMMDSYSSGKNDMCGAIYRVLTFKQAVFTDFQFLVPDGPDTTRPSTIIYSPIQIGDASSPVVGLFSGGFSWDDVLKGILPPEYKQVDCVVSTMKSTSQVSQLCVFAVSDCLSTIVPFHYNSMSFSPIPASYTFALVDGKATVTGSGT